MSISNRTLSKLWIVFFLTAFMSNYVQTYMISNLLVIILFILSLFYNTNKHISITLKMISFLMILSIIDTCLVNIPYISITSIESDFVLIGIFLISFAADRLYVPGQLYKLISYNALPLVFLFLLGGIHISEIGRINTALVNPNIKDVAYLLAFPCALYLLLHKRIDIYLGVPILICSLILIMYSGSRKDFIFVIFALLFNLKTLKELLNRMSSLKKILAYIGFATMSLFLIQQMIRTQEQRFLANTTDSYLEKMQEEGSALERVDYIKTSFRVSLDYPLGIGEGNIIPAIAKYGGIHCKLTKNVHSTLAQSLFIGGFAGCLVLILYMAKIILISLRDFNRWFFIPLLLIISFFAMPLFVSKIYWVVLVFFEKEIMYRDKCNGILS